jgi:dimethylhistidine N-methyltransferase
VPNPDTLIDTFAADVARDLAASPRQLQSQYLYDALGSSLFEAICRLPWYRITRAEGRLLARHAVDVIARLTREGDEAAIVELGVGSGEKLVTLIEALPPGVPGHVHLVDISRAALDATGARLAQFPQVTVTTHEGTYEDGLDAVARGPRAGGPQLVLFLGSNIGNFDMPDARALLRAMRDTLQPGDLLLLGADLVKPERELILAYDDPLGVTAAFNKNLLVRINRELGGNFDLGTFDHRAVWNGRERRVEMHLVSRRAQLVSVPGADLHLRFEAGDTIWTESSYKYSEAAIVELGQHAGFSPLDQWIDADARFALTLFRAR